MLKLHPQSTQRSSSARNFAMKATIRTLFASMTLYSALQSETIGNRIFRTVSQVRALSVDRFIDVDQKVVPGLQLGSNR